MANNTTIKRPIGMGATNQELEQLVPLLQSQSHQKRLYAEINWLVARCTMDGFSYNEANWENRKISFNPMNPKGSTRVDIPEMINRMRREVGRLMSILREPTTKPVVTGNSDIYRLNRFAKGGVAHIYKNTAFRAKSPVLIAEMLTDGTAATFPYWNSFNEPREDGEDGDVAIRTIPAWQLYPFPANAIDDESLEGIIWARPVTEEWLKRNFPDASGERTVQVGTPYDAIGTDVMSGQRISEGYLVREVFVKPSRRFPQGEHFWMVGDKIYKREGQLNFYIGKTRTIPITPCRWFHKATSWWGASFGYNVSRLNREINRQMSLLVRRAVMKAHPGYLMVPLGSCDIDQFKQQIGGTIQYRPSLINPEATRPYWLSYPPGTTDTDVVVNRLDNYMQDVTSQHDASEGAAAGRVDSAAGLQALVRQDMIPGEATIASVDRCVATTFAIALQIGKSRWKAPKQAVISGPAAGVRSSILINPREIPDLEHIEVVTALDLPMDKPTMLQFVGQLASSGFKGDEPKISVQEYRRFLMAMGINIPGVDLIDPDEETAWRENYIIYGDGMTPGQVPDPMPRLENSETHLRAHKLFAATMELHSASDAVRAQMDHHIALTAQNLSGAGIPTQFDVGLHQADNDQLTEEIEAAQMANAGQLSGANVPGLEQILARMAAGMGAQ